MEPLNKNYKIISDTIIKQILQYDVYPYYFSVVTFGKYSDLGHKLSPVTIEKFWDRNECERTAKRIYNALKETFGTDCVWSFIERHKDNIEIDDYGNETITKGRFHLNLVHTFVPDRFIEEPERKIKRLMGDNNRFGFTIKDQRYQDIEDLKIDLYDACIVRSCDWVNRFQHSVKTQPLLEPCDVEETIHYCLKDYKDGKISLQDVVLWKASDFIDPKKM
jgi:hypothetical protein